MGNDELNSISSCNKCSCRANTRDKMNALKYNENANCSSCGHPWNVHYD